MARKGDTPAYVRQMQEELFEVLGQARCVEELRRLEPAAREVYQRYLSGLKDADPRELVIHRRVGRTNYSKRCAKASAVQAYRKCGISPETGMEIGYVMRDAGRMAVDVEWNASEFDAEYYGKLLEKSWNEVIFVLTFISYS